MKRKWTRAGKLPRTKTLVAEKSYVILSPKEAILWLSETWNLQCDRRKSEIPLPSGLENSQNLEVHSIAVAKPM